MPTSQNGWPANDVTQTDVQLIPGTARKIRLRKGDVGFLLRRIAAWIDQNIENIDEATQDDWGYAERPIRGSTTTLSNHASGTAIDINATKHPLGVRGSWSAAERLAIHGHLAEYVDPQTGKNVVRWGDDYSGRPDGMHFEINVTPGHGGVGRVAAKLRQGKPTAPGSKPTTPVDDRLLIKTWSIVNAAGEGDTKAPTFKVTDEAWFDARVFAAWARAKGWTTARQEQGWVDATSRDARWEYGAQIFKIIVQDVQRHNGLAADGIFGPKTGAVMAKSGYTVR